mmetsp:Transcript_15957/g.30186  ORF Transcript_15957/g.30186 Transcript_15957/m.30186 type:complete len:224 (-) Transcript_15957:269-940(-)
MALRSDDLPVPLSPTMSMDPPGSSCKESCCTRLLLRSGVSSDTLRTRSKGIPVSPVESKLLRMMVGPALESMPRESSMSLRAFFAVSMRPSSDDDDDDDGDDGVPSLPMRALVFPMGIGEPISGTRGRGRASLRPICRVWLNALGSSKRPFLPAAMSAALCVSPSDGAAALIFARAVRAASVSSARKASMNSPSRSMPAPNRARSSNWLTMSERSPRMWLNAE